MCTKGGATAPSTTAPSAKLCVVPSTWLFLGPLRGPMGGGGAQPFFFELVFGVWSAWWLC